MKINPRHTSKAQLFFLPWLNQSLNVKCKPFWLFEYLYHLIIVCMKHIQTAFLTTPHHNLSFWVLQCGSVHGNRGLWDYERMCDAKFSLWKNTGSGFVGFDTFYIVSYCPWPVHACGHCSSGSNKTNSNRTTRYNHMWNSVLKSITEKNLKMRSNERKSRNCFPAKKGLTSEESIMLFMMLTCDTKHLSHLDLCSVILATLGHE